MLLTARPACGGHRGRIAGLTAGYRTHVQTATLAQRHGPDRGDAATGRRCCYCGADPLLGLLQLLLLVRRIRLVTGIGVRRRRRLVDVLVVGMVLWQSSAQTLLGFGHCGDRREFLYHCVVPEGSLDCDSRISSYDSAIFPFQ